MSPEPKDRGSLSDYRKKRDFQRTPEPAGEPQRGQEREPAQVSPQAGEEPTFCVQKHRARRLHYDFRLEVNGVLKSWAVPKGPSLDPADKRLAVMTEDHPLEYGGFEGTIPPDNYGAGTVLLWDQGAWEHLGPTSDPAADIAGGKLDFNLHGRKLAGRFALVRLGGGRTGTRGSKGKTSSSSRDDETSGGGREWLLLKKRDDFSRSGSDITREADLSVKTGLSIEEIAAEEPAVWNPATRRRLEALLRAERVAMPRSVAPMLATLVKSPPSGDEWLHELKYDGVRVIAYLERGAVRLESRSGRDQTALYPEIAEAIAELVADRAIVDGEIVALDENGHPSFHRLQPRMQAAPREAERLRREIPAVAFLFDLLYLDGYDLRSSPIEMRKEVLAALLDGAPAPLLYSDHVVGQGEAFFGLASQSAVEGIVSKRLGSAYVSKRSANWMKVKRIQEGEFVIGGFTAPQGSRAHLGALLIGLYEGDVLRYVTRVGSGLDSATLGSLYDELRRRERRDPPFANPPAIRGARWVEPQLVCRVRFGEWTDDGALRAPVFAGLVADVAPGDCRMPQGSAGGEAPLEAPLEATLEETLKETQEVREPRPRHLVDHSPRPGEVRLANPDKVLFPEDGIVKRDIFEYFRQVAPILLPHLRDRPLSLQRWPNGIAGESFFQKDAPDVIPPFVRTEPIASEDSRRTIRYIIADNEETLLWLANLTAFTLHPWGSRVGSLENPDFMILDLDPKEAPFSRVVRVARELKELLDAVGLRSYPKTTGSSGLHVYVPLEPEYSYEQVRGFAELVARVVASRLPDEATVELKVEQRGGRIYLDHLRNRMGQTAAGPYVVRALPTAPVSAPLTWEEVNERLGPRQFTIRNLPPRVAEHGDLWRPVLDDRQRLDEPLAALEEILAG